MKFQLFGLGCLLGLLVSLPSCEAFIAETGLVRQERTVSLSVVNKEAHVRVRSVWMNSTPTEVLTRSWFPLPPDTTSIQCFLNAEGQEFHTFESRAQLDALADAAEKNRDVRFFRLAETPWKQVVRTHDFILPANETSEIVWEYSFPVLHQGGFEGVEVFLDDGVQDELFRVEVSIASAEEVIHFWAPLLAQGVLDRSSNGMVVFHQNASFTPPENLRILWSSEAAPEARFYRDPYEYIAHFQPLSPVQTFSRITLLLDASGSMSDVWAHVQELVRFFLKHQEEQQFRLAFVEEEGLKWIVGDDMTFEANTVEVQQKIIEAIGGKSPLGKGNLSPVLPVVRQPEENHLVIVFSDEIVEDTPTEGAPVAALQFFPFETSSAWQKFALATKGFVQQAFRSILGTQEAEDLLSQIRERRQTLSVTEVFVSEGEQDVLPLEIVPHQSFLSPVFIGRKVSGFQPNEGRSWFDWVPRQWAAFRLADLLLDGQEKKTFSLDVIDAILSLARSFGIETELFSENTSRDQLAKTLSQSDDLWLTVEKLWKGEMQMPETGIRLIDAVPLWKDMNNVWRSFDFYDRLSPERWIQIAPFSAAQRQLFVLFPDIFARAFGIGEYVDFCTLFRCFSLVPDGRTEARPSDRAFLRDFNPGHWANEFVIDLVDKGILEPELNGKLHLERPVSRGDFVSMLVADRYSGDRSPDTASPSFTDLTPDSPFFQPVELFVSQGIIRGYPDGTFRPLQDLSRAEAVKILLAADGFTSSENLETMEPTFPDTPGWERPWVEEAVRRGIVQGHPDGFFRPHDPLSRAAGAKLVVQSR